MTEAKLVYIRVSGFRRLQEPLEIDMTFPNGDPSDFLVVAGGNGSGKTSLLEAILLGLGREDLIVRDLPKGEREEHWRGLVPAGAEIRLDFRVGDQCLSVVRTADTHLVQERLEPGASAGGQTWQWKDRAVTRSVAYFSSWRGPALRGALKPLGAGRRPSNTESNRLWLIKQRIIDERARGAFSKGTVPLRDKEWLSRINEVWHRFHGHDGTSLEADIDDIESDDPSFDVYILEKDGRRRCSIDQASSGELELFVLMGSLLLDDFSGLCLIDEVELHLHREWQTAILPALRGMAPNAQFIVTTHANAPWDQAFSFQRTLLVDESDPRSGAGK